MPTSPQPGVSETLDAIIQQLERLRNRLNQSSTPSLTSIPPSSHQHFIHDPYDTQAASLLIDIQPFLVQHHDALQKTYLDCFRELTADIYAPEEQRMLAERWLNHFRTIMAPHISLSHHRKLAEEMGRQNELASIPADSLSQIHDLYLRTLLRLTPQLGGHAQATHLLEQRFSRDATWQLTTYMQRIEHRNHFLKQLLSALQKQINRDDLLDQVINVLRETDGIVGVGLGAFIGNNQLICEKAGGLILHGYECTMDDSKPFKSVPLLRAWKEEKPVWIHSVLREVDDECMRDDARHLGIRSYAVLPLRGDSGSPEMLMMLYSAEPGFFCSQDKQFFCESIAQGLYQQIQRIEKRLHAHFTELGVAERQHYRRLLENGQIEMVFQPIIDPRRKRVIKVEALARLVDEGRHIAPYQFLGAFGAMQLIALFECGLERVCAMLRRLEEETGIIIGASINLPTEAFEHPQVLHRIHTTAKAFQIEPTRIALEILESGTLDEASATEAITRLKSLGFTIAMDDMGSGESSMLRMKTLPLDEIKIDQGFVRPLLNQLDHLDYVDTLIRLAENLHLSCVVEGVENDEIADVICTLGHAYLQGYGIARPMTEEQLVSWIQQYHQQSADSDKTDSHLPETLYGWYARHLKRARVILDALPNNRDLIDFSIAAHYQRCPMTAILKETGLQDHPLYAAHKAFHDTIAALQTGEEDTTALKKRLLRIIEEIRSLIEKEGADSHTQRLRTQ